MAIIIRMCSDTSMMYPWGKGDIAVGIGFPGSGITILQCVKVNREETEETVTMSYSLQEWSQDPPLGWDALLKDGDGK